MDDYFDHVEDQLGALIEAGAHRRRSALRLPAMPRIHLGGLMLAASTVAVVAIAAFVLLNVHSGPSSPSAPAESQAQIDPALVRDFKILRRPVMPSDRLPANFVGPDGLAGVERGDFSYAEMWPYRYGPRPTVPSLGLLPALTRRTTIPGTGFKAWLIPGRHGMCWFAEQSPAQIPSSAVCVGSLQASATALIDGPWTAVELVGQSVVGLVTDRVHTVRLITGRGPGHPIPLRDGFYVAPNPIGHERLVAATRAGIQPLYPQRTPGQPLTVGAASDTISRTSRPSLVLTGTTTARVQLQWEMTCGTQAGPTQPGTVYKGYQHSGSYTVPATVPIGFPNGSSKLPSCYVAATATIPPHARGTAHVAITTH